MTRKLIAFLIGALFACSTAYADVWQAEYGVARTFDFTLFNADGTLDVDEADSGTEVTLDCNGTPATATNDFADEGSFYSIALTAAELQCERVTVTVAATLVSVFHIETFGHASGFNETLGWLTGDAFARLGAPAGASIAADLVTIDNFIDTEVADILTDTGTTLDDFLDTEVAAILSDTNAILVDTGTTLDDFLDTEIADIRRAIGPATTTIATLASQTSFTLTAGSADDNAYNGWGLVVVDASTATQTALGCVLDYTGATRTVTLRSDPAIFTMATTDNVILLPSFCTTGVDVSTIETVDATDQLDAHAAAGLDAAGVRAAVGLASANLDIQLTNIDNFVDTEVADILTDTGTTLDDFLDTEVAAILADADEVQQSLANGGLIESMVDDIGAAGAGLTAADDAVIAAIAALNDLSTADVRDLVIEDQGGGVSLGCAIAVVLAYVAGDLSTTGANSTYEDPSGAETRATGTVASAGNRTAAITCPSY